MRRLLFPKNKIKIWPTLLTLSFCFSILLTSNAQCSLELKGKVIDAETGLPVSYAFIEIKSANQTTVADSNGVYILDHLCAGQYQLICSRIGFILQERTITIPCDTVIINEIEFDPTFYRSVDIITSKKQHPDGVGINTLSKENLIRNSGQSLSEQLENIQGVYSLKTGTGISKPIIHGLHSTRILIYNNGIRHEGQQWGSEHAPEIDPQLAENITVAFGSAGLRYGHDVIGGVVLVEPSEIRKSPGVQGELNTTAMSNGRIGSILGMVQANFKKIKSIGLMLQGTLQKSGNMNTPHLMLDNTGRQNMNYAAGINFTRSRFSMQFFYSIFSADIGIFSGSHTGNLTDLTNIISGKVQQTDAEFSYDIGRPKQHVLHELHKVRLNYITGINSKLEIRYARQYNLREEYDKHLPRNDSIAGLNRPELKLEITTHSTDAEWVLRKGTKHTFQTGATAVYQGNTYEGRFVIPNFNRYAYGAFFYYQKQGEKSKLESCVRYDVNELVVYRYVNNTLTNQTHETSNYAMSLSLDHKFNESVHTGISAGRTWRAMQANELYSNGLHHGSASFEKGDSTLNQEVSLNLLGQFNYTSKVISFEINPFIQYIKGFTYQIPQVTPILTIRGAFPVFLYTQKNAILQGADALFKIDLGKGYVLRSNCSILRAKEIGSKKFLSQMPADRYGAQLLKVIQTGERLRNTFISLGVKFINKQWRSDSEQDYLPAPHAYVLYNAEAGTTIHFNDADIIISIASDNLLNTTYRDYLNRFRYYSDETGRNVTFRLTYQFKQNKSTT